jgi:hypothetical protein
VFVFVLTLKNDKKFFIKIISDFQNAYMATPVLPAYNSETEKVTRINAEINLINGRDQANIAIELIDCWATPSERHGFILSSRC